jgi:hypothetical protein
MPGEITTDGWAANRVYGNIDGRNNDGGLYAGNSVLAAGVHADGTATNANLGNLATQVQFGFDNSLEVARESRNIDQFGKVQDNQFRAELRGSDQLAALTREVANNARVTDSCCCETGKQMATGFAALQLEGAKNQGALLLKMCEDKNDLSKQMAEGFGNIKDRELNAANAKIIQLETVNALSNTHRG